MHASRPHQFWALFATANGAALAILVFVLLQARVPAGPIAVVAVAAVVFEMSHVVVREDNKVTLSVIVLFAAVAYGGLPLAVVAGLATGIVSGFTARSDRLVKGAINTAMSIIEAAGAAVAFSLIVGSDMLGPDPDAALREPVLLTLGLLCAGAVSSLLNGFLLGGVLQTASGLPFRQTVRDILRTLLVLQFVYVGLAAIAYVLLIKAGPYSLLLLTVPLVVARQSLLSVQERQEAYDRMVRAFVKAIELKDGYTRGHAERVSDLSVLVAERMGLS